ncbi:MAG: FtsX-like permease family protein [Chloroflexota bacterium]|nr:FtsX-like permease family protein [Chloroflexota bacterium]
MSFRDLLHLVISNLRRMKARVAMTAIGVVIGTAAVVVLISLAAGLQRSVTQDLGSIGELTQINVYSRGRPDRAGEEAVLNDQALAKFRKLPGVVAVTPLEPLMVSGMLRLNRLVGNAQITGIDPTQVGRLDFVLASGTDRLGRWQVLAGGQVADGFYNPQSQRPAEEPLDLQGQSLQLVLSRIGDDGQSVERVVRLRVTGVLEESGGRDDHTLYLALDDVVELNGWFAGKRLNPGRDGYNQGALVKVATSEHITAVEREIVSQGFYAYSARSMMREINTVFLVIQGVFGGIGAIALIVAAFGIANTMTMAIYERTREIGLMKAVGATNRDVMSIFLAEAGSIGLLGGIGGVLLGVGLGALIDVIAGTYLAAQAVQSGASAADLNISLIHTPLWLPIFAVLFSALVGVASGLYPAMRAAALSPVAALKYE